MTDYEARIRRLEARVLKLERELEAAEEKLGRAIQAQAMVRQAPDVSSGP
jgi:multidrug resistance efflux pump